MNPQERREWVQDVVAHSLAVIVVLGFFSVIFLALSGMVDLANQTVALFVGSAMGYAAAKTELVLARYFKIEVKQAVKEKEDEDPTRR